MIKYFIKRIMQDWGEELGFIAGIGCFILVIFINTEIVNYTGIVDYTGWSVDDRRGVDLFWGRLMIIPEGFMIYFMIYLSNVYDDYKKKQVDDYCYKIKSGGENHGRKWKD